MMKSSISVICLLFCSLAFAQSEPGPTFFLPRAQNSEYGYAGKTALGPDGTIFLLRPEGKLCAYSYDGSSFQKMATTTTYPHVDDVLVGPDGTVFLTTDSLIALGFDGSCFTPITSIAVIDEGPGFRCAIGPKGTLFTVNSWGCLSAYQFDGTSFTLLGSVDDWGTGEVIAVAADGTVFLQGSTHGLRACSFNGSTFTLLAQLNENAVRSEMTMAIDTAGTLFLGQRGASHNMLYAYDYDGVSFSYRAEFGLGEEFSEGIAVSANGIVFLANARSGLRAISYTGDQFLETASFANGAIASDVMLLADETIILANGTDALRSFNLDETELTCTAHSNDGGSANGIAIGAEGDMILANGLDGLRAYIFVGDSMHCMAHTPTPSSANRVVCGSGGTVFLTSGDSTLSAYSFDGSSFAPITELYIGDITRRIIASTDGTLFLANGLSGLIAVGFEGSELFVLDKVPQLEHEAWDVTHGPDGTIFLANGWGGIHCYTFENNQFTEIAHTSDYEAGSIVYRNDGTVFTFTRGMEGGGISEGPPPGDLRAFHYSDFSFIHESDTTFSLFDGAGMVVGADGMLFVASKWFQLGAFEYSNQTFQHRTSTFGTINSDLAIGDDGTIFLAATYYGGLIAYSYMSGVGIDEHGETRPQTFQLFPNYPNPFNPSTTISYTIPELGQVELIVYDVLGQEVNRLVSRHQLPGSYAELWNGTDTDGNPVSTGVYFARLKAGEFSQTIKMVLLK